MAGAGKTTFMQRLNAHVHENSIPSYFINLDPAVLELPYNCNIDIRGSVDYSAVMNDYRLGPNGAIMTSLNLFATKFDQVLGILKHRAETSELKYIFVDTPGQIEMFTWSASGSIITELLASEFPTVISYVVDTPRVVSPITFMSSILYACSILYRSKLPLILTLNKCDIQDGGFIRDYLTDYDTLHEAFDNEQSYMASLSRSMALALEEFYTTLPFVECSAKTGEGMIEFFDELDLLRKKYNEEYLSFLEDRKQKKEEEKEKEKQRQLEKLANDIQGMQEPVKEALKLPEGDLDLLD
eukprot:TRINITY_DN3120_c0_g10_i1.p1 TRINITY_DN3120_c0_g10~~TRINITY_DN3120_c0_g10_i1.p1  ORF type:complete len:322 (+),score=91.43 TRINITY_DN3120_c0_g10_i1:74-967(+)